MTDTYLVSTKSTAIAAGSYPAIVAGFIGLGKQPNKFDPSKPPSTKFVLVYRLALESGTTTWCKTYTAAWGPKAGFFKDCGPLFAMDQIKAGALSPTALIGKPCTLAFTQQPAEDGTEKTVLLGVLPLAKTPANVAAVKPLLALGTFQFDAAKGERPTSAVAEYLPKWLAEMIETTGPGQPAAAVRPSTTLATMQPAAAQPTATTAPAPAAAFDDNLDDLSW